MDRIKYQDYNGTEITLDQYGQFCAEVNGVFLSRTTLEALKHCIDDETKGNSRVIKLALPCYGLIRAVEGYEYTIAPLTLEGMNRNNSTLKWTEVPDKAVRFALPATDENLATLQEYAQALNTEQRIDREINGRKLNSTSYGGRILPTEYAKCVDDLRQRYERCLEAANARRETAAT